MKTPSNKALIIFLIFAIHYFSYQAAFGQNHCALSPQATRQLARDQRDDVRLKCLKQKSTQLSTSLCLQIAKTMEYSTNAEEGRLLCLAALKRVAPVKDCLKIAEQMEYPDSGDQVRWDCLNRYNRTLSQKQCRIFADKMSYPANTQRAHSYCSHELQ